LIFDYNHAEMFIKAFEDYLKGPDFIKNSEPETLHSNILNLSKSYKSQNVQQNYLPPNHFHQPSRSGKLKKLVSLLTLNGHLLPNFLTSDEDVFIWKASGYPGQLSKAFAKKRVIIFNEKMARLFQNEIDKWAGIKVFTRWLKVAAKSSIKWSSISTEWKNASKELTSTRFWQQYLGLKK
jgi:galactofuranosylgalactofuranosylrhamnosyl-N-acetylglucosaminyl-diphospho-decaprenol beta-1,5/1,6-galactofuranosyltransferase